MLVARGKILLSHLSLALLCNLRVVLFHNYSQQSTADIMSDECRVKSLYRTFNCVEQ